MTTKRATGRGVIGRRPEASGPDVTAAYFFTGYAN